MGTEHLPVEYRMEIYVDSFVNDPDASLHGTSPFMAVHVGDTMEPSIWPNPQYGRDKIAKVTAVRHLLWEIKDKHVSHSISVCVKIEDKAD